MMNTNTSYFINLLEKSMKNIVPKEQKLESIASSGKDKSLMDSLIQSYQSSTKNAVENILNMCGLRK